MFVSHCVLDENVRYLGGAFRSAGISEIVERCMAKGIGVVQMPCPEQAAWGGVLKPWFLRAIGNRWLARASVRRLAVAAFLGRTRRVYARLARRVASEIEEHVRAGVDVVGIVGIDGSPSCGVRATLDVRRCLPLFVDLDVEAITAGDVNAIVRATAIAGRGMFVEALRSELARRGIDVPFDAHDLFAEMDDRASSVSILERAS